MSTTAREIPDTEGRNEHAWTRRARYFNSGNAFALALPEVPSATFIEERDLAFAEQTPTGLITMDISAELGTDFPATTPLVLSRYARIRAGESLPVEVAATAQLLCILEGRGHTQVGDETIAWGKGDILALPGTAKAVHSAQVDAVAWLVTDEPAIAYLGTRAPAPEDACLEPVHYPARELDEELERLYQHPDVETFPGYAVVLSHQALEHTRNIHCLMTLALNSLPPGESQRPHVHSSMALTLCLEGEDCYSMVDGKRKDWSQHAVMVTPPFSPHSHHNDGPERMRCLIVQDGAVHYHARTIGFAYADD